MSKQTLRYAILVLGLITGVIHTDILPLRIRVAVDAAEWFRFFGIDRVGIFRPRFSIWTAQIDNLSVHGLYPGYDCGLLCVEF